jgi:SAM-dependent methyltransferase
MTMVGAVERASEHSSAASEPVAAKRPPTPAAAPPPAGGIGALLRRLLAHPLTRGHDLDDPTTTALRRQIVRGKPFLRRIYQEWYALLATSIPPAAEVPGRVLELGSGAGFFDEVVPETITSDIMLTPGARVVLDGLRLPVEDGSLRAIVMTNVFHHLPDARRFLTEAARAVRPGGVVAMVEPWISTWSRIVYRKLHHEPCLPEATEWSFPASGPLSSANEAQAWIVFRRDAEIFRREFPQWRIEEVRAMMPLRYLLSGGVSMRALAPSFTFPVLRGLERAVGTRGAMFAYVRLRRSEQP